MRCVKSIIDQKIPDSFEILVVDDGSEECPNWLCESFGSEFVRVIQIEHGGPGAARNRGIEEAKGKYIQFIDADDCLQPDSINSCLEILHTEQPQILRYHYNVCHSERAALERIKAKPLKCSNTISGAAFMATHNLSGSPCTYFFERELATKHDIRFATNVYHEDEEFNTILHYYATSLIDSNAIIYNYCIRKESITSNTDKDFEKRRIENLFELLTRLIAFKESVDKKSNTIQRRALQHKITKLAVDTILNLLFDGKEEEEILELCNKRLRPLQLYPLPKADYGIKYTIFRLLANSRRGVAILRYIVPKYKPAKR